MLKCFFTSFFYKLQCVSHIYIILFCPIVKMAYIYFPFTAHVVIFKLQSFRNSPVSVLERVTLIDKLWKAIFMFTLKTIVSRVCAAKFSAFYEQRSTDTKNLGCLQYLSMRAMKQGNFLKLTCLAMFIHCEKLLK